MTIKQLKAFLAVAKFLNYAQACEELCLSQPALSLAIKNLEESLGGTLFIRNTRNVRLTPEGEEFLENARKLLAHWEKTIEQTQQRFELQRGLVSIASMPIFAINILPKILKIFKQKFSNVNITVHDVIHEDVLKMVSSNQVEIGIGFEPESSDIYNFIPLINDKFIAVLPKNLPIKSSSYTTWKQLLNHDFITLQRPSIARYIIEKGLMSTNIKLKVAFDCHQVSTIGKMVASNLGVSVVPSICKNQMEELGCTCVELIEPIISRDIGIIFCKDTQLSKASEELIKILINNFRINN